MESQNKLLLIYNQSKYLFGMTLWGMESVLPFFIEILKRTGLASLTYEEEMLVKILAVQKWRPYFLGRHLL